MTVSINNDRNLIEGLLEQSQRAQQQLLSNYGSYVFAQVARLIPSQADAEEVYQDVFVRVFSPSLCSTLSAPASRPGFRE